MTSKPKVAIIGGVDIDARAQFMKQLSSDYEICAVGSNPDLTEKFRALGLQYETYDLPRKVSPLADLRAMLQLRQIFRRVKPDIVHTFDTKPGVWGSLAGRLAAVPVVVVTFTGLGSLYLSEDFRTRCLRGIYESLQRFTSRFIDHSIFQNHDDAERFINAKIVPRDKVGVILGSGIDTARFDVNRFNDEQRARLRAELGLESGETVVTMVARLVRTKGVLEFAEAAERVRLRFPKTRFLLVGPEDHDSLDRLTEDEMAQLRASLDLLGARRDVPDILSISDAFVLPSYREGIPRVLLEAAAMELAIITTDSAGCNEVVRDGENGLLTPPGDANAIGDALLAILGSAERRRAYGRASRRRAVELFDIAVVKRQTDATYRNLLGKLNHAAVPSLAAMR